MTYSKASSSPIPDGSMLKENKKRKVHPAKVNKGFKKLARIEVEDPAFEENDIEVNSEDEAAMVYIVCVCSIYNLIG